MKYIETIRSYSRNYKAHRNHKLCEIIFHAIETNAKYKGKRWVGIIGGDLMRNGNVIPSVEEVENVFSYLKKEGFIVRWKWNGGHPATFDEIIRPNCYGAQKLLYKLNARIEW